MRYNYEAGQLHFPNSNIRMKWQPAPEKYQRAEQEMLLK